jgi:hypothetical protein
VAGSSHALSERINANVQQGDGAPLSEQLQSASLSSLPHVPITRGERKNSENTSSIAVVRDLESPSMHGGLQAFMQPGQLQQITVSQVNTSNAAQAQAVQYEQSNDINSKQFSEPAQQTTQQMPDGFISVTADGITDATTTGRIKVSDGLFTMQADGCFSVQADGLLNVHADGVMAAAVSDKLSSHSKPNRFTVKDAENKVGLNVIVCVW